MIIGGALAVGLLSKANVAGLLPGTAVGLAALLWRARPAALRPGLLGAGAAALATIVPYVAWLGIARLAVGGTPSPTGGLASSSVSAGLDGFKDQAGYIWQSVLPRLPFMHDHVPWYPLWDTYFQGFIGRFGWFEYGFSDAWYVVALVIFTVIAALAVRGLFRCREALRRRWLELATYAALAGGLFFALEVVAYRYHLALDRNAYFEQARYLFPLLPLYGAFVAVAARGAGRRWGPAVGAFLVVLAMGHSLFAQLITISRFYS